MKKTRLMGVVLCLVGLSYLFGFGPPFTSAQSGWPPVKLDLTVQQDGATLTAVVWVQNDGDFDTDTLNVKAQIPKGARYIDSWAGSGRGFNRGAFDGNDVSWVNAGVRAGGKQGPFVYLFDVSDVPPGPNLSFSAWAGWAGKVPGTAMSTPAPVAPPVAFLTTLDSRVGPPPEPSWRFAIVEMNESSEATDGPHNHGNIWSFITASGAAELTTADSMTTARAGEATLIPARQDHTHRYLPQTRVVAVQLRPADRPPGELHGGQQLLISEPLDLAAGTDYSLRVREFTLAPGSRAPESIPAEAHFGYVAEGTLTSSAGGTVSMTEAGKVFTFPRNVPHVDSNAGATPLRFILVDLHP